MGEKCQVTVYPGRGRMWEPSRPCGRPVKSEGLCGVHLGAKVRREAKEAQRGAARIEAERLTERLARHGIEASVGYDGTVYLPPAARLLEALDAKYPEADS